MKTITFNATNISAYIFDDSADIVSTDTEITCPNFIIGDLNSTNATVHNGVTPPDDWQGGNYLFDGATWTLTPDWIDPRLREIAELEARIAVLKQ
jgi:hypothetical protein